MLKVKIINSNKDCWYYNIQFKNSKAKTFEVIPNADCTKFIIMNGDQYGKEIDPMHVKDISAKDVLEIFKSLM